MWAVDQTLNFRMVAEIERKRNSKQTLGPARMARCGDLLLMVWGHYTNRVGSKKPRSWQGLLHAASYEPATQTLSEIVDAVADPRVVAATLQVEPVGESIVVTWESRPKRGGGGMRAMRFSSIADLPGEAVVLPEKCSPLFMPYGPRPILRAGRLLESGSWAIPGDLPEL